MGLKKVSFLIIDITLKGGIERVVSNLSNELDHKYEIEIISFFRTYNNPTYLLSGNVKLTFLSNLKFKYWNYKFLLAIIFLTNLFKIIKIRKNSISIGMYPIINIICISLFRFDSNSLIASEHSEYYSQSKILIKLRKYFYQRLKYIITLTKSGLMNFEANNLNAISIPNSVTTFQNPRQWKCQKSEEEITCLFVGRLEQVKQPRHFISLAQYFNEQGHSINFHMLGGGPLEFDLKAEIDLLNLKNIQLLGNVDSVDNFYSESHYLIITSKTEALPMVVLESMSFGCIVIGYSCQIGTSEIIQDGVSGFLVEEGDILAIEKIIRSLSVDKKRFLEISQNAIQRANDFKSNRIASQWCQLIDNI